MRIPWLQPLKRLAEDKRLVIIRFDESEWQSLNEFPPRRVARPSRSSATRSIDNFLGGTLLRHAPSGRTKTKPITAAGPQ